MSSLCFFIKSLCKVFKKVIVSCLHIEILKKRCCKRSDKVQENIPRVEEMLKSTFCVLIEADH